MYRCDLKILSMHGQANGEWQGEFTPNWQFTEDLNEFIEQPFKIVLERPFFNRSESFDYNSKLAQNIDIGNIDLLLLHDYGFETSNDITEWLHQINVKNYVLLHQDFKINHPDKLLRYYWITTANVYSRYTQDDINLSCRKDKKNFMFSVLLGTPRFDRSYIMLRLLNNPELLKKSLVGFREEFYWDIDSHTGEYIKHTLHDKIKDLKNFLYNDNFFMKLNHIDKVFPYVSPELQHLDDVNLQEARQGEDFPIHVYEQTWYSIVSETNFFVQTITEKIGWMFFSKRIFILFSAPGVLKILHQMGFKTFSDVIDESYNNEEDQLKRLEATFDQVNILSTKNPEEVYSKMQSVLEHNYRRLFEYIKECKNEAHNKLLAKIPPEYIISCTN